MKRSTGFQYIDRDRLLLAIRIAKRDVQCLAFSNGEDNTYIHEPPEKINVNHNSASIDYNSTNVTRNFHETQKPISGKSRISASRNGLQRVVCKPTVPEQYQTMENKMPVRSDSPPIRDTDNWTPNRRRALHEPTERQLRNSQESRIRQLQAKMSQYSAALAEIQEKYLMDKISPRESKSSNELMKKSFLKPSRNRPKSSSVSTSVIRPKFTSLRPRSIHKSNLHYPNKTQKPVSSSSIKQINDNDTMSPITNSMNSENHYNSKIDSLWEQAAKSLNINKSDIVILQPDKSKHLTDQSCEKSLHTSINGCNSQISSNQLNTDTINSNFDNDNILRRAIEQLLLEIDQAEIEENVIRRRWANKLVYIDDRMHSSNCFHSIAKTDPVCINHNSNLISTSCGEFQSEMKYKPFLCPDPPADPITSPLPQNKVDAKVESICKPENNQSTSLSHFHSLILPVKLHRQLLQSKIKRDVQARNMWFYLDPSTNFNNLPDVPVAYVCEDLTNDIIHEIIDGFYQTIDRTASELVDELIKAELLPEAPDTSLSFDRYEDDLHCLSTPALFRQSDLIVREFDAPIISKNCDKEQITSNTTSMLENDSNIPNEQSTNESSNCHKDNDSQESSDKYTSEFENDTVS